MTASAAIRRFVPGALGLFAAAALAALSPTRPAVEIAAQERAFARMSVEKGVRASFSEYFAPDAIAFDAGVPAPASPAKDHDAAAPFVLDWEPYLAQASAAGDLGWDTGPYVLTDRPDHGNPPRHGWFLSVWRRQTDGRWKVALDVGTEAPAPGVPLRPATLEAFPFIASRPPRLPGPPEKETAALLARDRASSDAKPDALWLAEARLHREGGAPVVGLAAVEKKVSGRGPFRTSPAGGGVAKSGDLGYTYGTYALGPGEKGGYARVWLMTESGDWKIAVQVEKPAPQEK